MVSPARRASHSASDRLRLALDLLQDNAFDALLAGTWTLDDLPDVLARLADGRLEGLCHTVSYGEGQECSL